MKRLRLISQALLAALMLSGCSGYRPAPDGFHKALDEPYRLGAGDRIRVTVFEQESLTNTYSVDQSGYIAFPLVGAVAGARPFRPADRGHARSPSCARAICAIPTCRSKSTAIARSS